MNLTFLEKTIKTHVLKSKYAITILTFFNFVFLVQDQTHHIPPYYPIRTLFMLGLMREQYRVNISNEVL